MAPQTRAFSPLCWFGAPWGAAVCREVMRVKVPEGEACVYCAAPITWADGGFVTPLLTAEGHGHAVYHRACFLRAILPPDLAEEAERACEARW